MSDDALFLFGKDLFGNAIEPDVGKLRKEFVEPPFDVLDGRREEWKERKRAWKALGIKSELGRVEDDGQAVRSYSAQLGSWLEKVDNQGHRTDFAHGWKTHETSIFDPVLAEIIVRWWSKPGDLIVDPFCGGSVRGIVSGFLNRRYVGLDLRLSQIAKNRKQAESISCACDPIWVVGDATQCPVNDRVDLLFTCPPYGDLEVYSSDHRDLSTMPHDVFFLALRNSLRNYCGLVKSNGIVVLVVGNFRSPRSNSVGELVPLSSHAVQIMQDLGFYLENQAVHLKPVGTLAIRARNSWVRGGKLGRCHEYVLVFKRRR